MSAWVIGRDHLDLLVTALIDLGICDPATGEKIGSEDADALGRELWAENVASVKYRYGLDGRRQEMRQYRRAIDAYAYIPCAEPRGAWQPGEVVNMGARSLSYQSCEHPEWEASRASRIIDALIRATTHDVQPCPEASARGWSFTRHGVQRVAS